MKYNLSTIFQVLPHGRFRLQNDAWRSIGNVND